MAVKFNGQPNWYGYEDAKGFPGMKATSVVDTVQSFAADGEVKPGTLVKRSTENTVKAISSSSDIPVGVVIHTHHEPGYVYDDGATVPVMVSGEVYVEVTGAVSAGEHAYMDATGNICGTASGSTEVQNMRFMESAADGEITRLRIVK